MMRFVELILVTLLMRHGLALPTRYQIGGNSLAKEIDPLIAAGRTAPFNPNWNYCQTKCNCAKRFNKSTQRDEFFQCITDPNCEQCERNGMNPPQA
ncbi:hypothetical protein CDEST_09207 [Colletotrichum destructivum]|uniref:Uncharacterized protein n=1 Tax=Colletotrichum destructivum TaxID=34406 RepID=A0AAX4IME9_9PEZI|nr:hypothetical protein CDEST_09207 [Colletotrichum destructivum]